MDQVILDDGFQLCSWDKIHVTYRGVLRLSD
jgi:hypothetical protein